METVIVVLKHAKAKELLQNLEEMNVIQVMNNNAAVQKPEKISDLRKLMKRPLDSGDAVDEQLRQLRDEWERSF